MKKHDIKHHLSKELLLAYSTGQLEEGFSLAIATHISMCDQCRAELESLEAMVMLLMQFYRKLKKMNMLLYTQNLVLQKALKTQELVCSRAGKE